MSKLYDDNRVIAMTRSELLNELRRIPITKLSTEPQVTMLCECEYCNSVVDTTYINCPNCGAPIKRVIEPFRVCYEWNGFPVEVVEDDI